MNRLLTVLLAATAWLAVGAVSTDGVRARAAGPDGNGYRYERYVRPGAAGPNRLAVDLPLLAGGSPFSVVVRQSGVNDTVLVAQGGLSDLRFFDEDHREVPYLLVQPVPRAAQWVRGRLLPIAATKKSSGFEVDLGAARAVDRLLMEGLPRPYLKRVRVEGSGDRARWTLLADEATVFNLPDEKLTREQVEFGAGEFRYLRVTWDDTSSARMPLPRSAAARLVAPGAPPATLRAPLHVERRDSEPGVSRYRVALPAPRMPVAALELSVGSGYVLRQARVMEARLNGAELIPVELGAAVLRRAVRDNLAASELRVPIAAPQERELELVVEDGSNPPLDLTGVTAVFAELPWIYFEAASTRSILGRYGATNATAPRYDLEAVRPSLGRMRIADANWGEPLALEGAATRPGAAPVPVLGAAVDAGSFAYRRGIPLGPHGLTALRLDAAVLSHSPFRDLRIVTPGGKQVAYLVERLDEPLALGLALKPAPPLSDDGAFAGANQTVYRVDLPASGLPSSRLVLQTTSRVFSRTVRVLAQPRQPNTRNDRRLDLLGESSWTHAEPETPAPALTLQLAGLLPATLLVVVDEGDNSRLPIEAARLLVPAYRLRFFRETDEPLSLLYGNGAAAAPRYDLALLAPRLVGAAAHEVWPAPENASSGPPARLVTASKVFWGALIAAVLVLLAILGRLLRT